MDFRDELSRATTRRQFLGRSTTGIGVMALASLLNENLLAGTGVGSSTALPAGGAWAGSISPPRRSG